MRLKDSPRGYGWISIALHWIAALVVLSLWFIGSSIRSTATPDPDATIRLHTTIALLAYVVLWARVIWRFRSGHPGALPTQSGGVFYLIGKSVHYLLITAITGMLITGPLMAWSGGVGLRVFDLAIPSPIPVNAHLFEASRWLHRNLGLLIMIATALHVGGVVKHLVFDRDGTFDKIMLPQKDDPPVD